MYSALPSYTICDVIALYMSLSLYLWFVIIVVCIIRHFQLVNSESLIEILVMCQNFVYRIRSKIISHFSV